jgi:predicted N-acetyltransferase YhbS
MRYVPSLDRAAVEEASRQNHALWGAPRTLSAHTAHAFAQLAEAGPELLRYVGLVHRGRLVGSIKRYGLLLRGPGGALLRAVGIGAVFTRPSMRGRGVAAELVRAVLGEAADLGYDAAFLYSDIEPAYYERLGFVRLPARDWSLPPAALPARGALAARPATPDDLDRMIGWFEEAWQREHPGHLRPARSRAIWRYFRWRNRIAGEWILSKGKRDVGYLVAGLDDPLRDLPAPRPERLFWVDEAAAPGVPRERIAATIRSLAERAGARSIAGWVGPEGAPAGSAEVERGEAIPMIVPLARGLRIDPARSYLDAFMHF